MVGVSVSEKDENPYPKKMIVNYKSHKKGQSQKPMPIKIYTARERLELESKMDMRIVKKRKRIVIP